jgi:hypothetical protein
MGQNKAAGGQSLLGDGTTEDRLSPVKIAEEVDSCALDMWNIAYVKGKRLYAAGSTVFVPMDVDYSATSYIGAFSTSLLQMTPVPIRDGVERVLPIPGRDGYTAGFIYIAATTKSDGTMNPDYGTYYVPVQWWWSCSAGAQTPWTNTDGHPVQKLSNNTNFVRAGQCNGYSGWMLLDDTHDLYVLGANHFTATQPTSLELARSGVTGISGTSLTTDFVTSDGVLWTVGAPLPFKRAMKPVVENVSLGVGSGHQLYVKADGSLWAAGNNSYGQLANGVTGGQVAPAKIDEEVVTASAGSVHSLYVKANGSLWAAGYNYYGQLGDGTTVDKATPVQISDNVVGVAAGGSHSLFVKAGGSLWAMGANSNGQLGDGTTVNKSTPAVVASGVASVSAGGSHSFYVTTEGGLWGMGSNYYGQLGDGTQTDQHTPLQIDTGVASVSAGASHTLYVKTDGSLWAMGANAQGQLGDGTTTDRAVPFQIDTGVVAAAAGTLHSFYIKTDGSLWGMGSGRFVDVALSATPQKLVPGGVIGLVAGSFQFIQQIGFGTVPVVTQQPASAELVAGQYYELSVEATGSAPLSFEWYKNGEPLEGAVSNTYRVFHARTEDLGRFKVLVRNSAGQIWSEDAVLALPTPTVVVAPKDTTVDTSEEVTVVFTADVVSTETVAFQWQVWVPDEPSPMIVERGAVALMDPGHWENVTDNGVFSGATTPTLALSQLAASMQGMRFRCVATDASGDQVTTPVATLALAAPEAPSITVQPVGVATAVGSAAQFQVAATSGLVLSYQWQVLSSDSSTWVDLVDGAGYSGSTTASLTLDALTVPMHNNQYRCQVSDGINPAVTSSVALLSVAAPVITVQPAGASTRAGVDANFSVTATSSLTLAYQWQVSSDGSTWTDLADDTTYAGATTAILTVRGPLPALNGMQYRCEIADGLNPDAISDAVALTVTAPLVPAITVQPAASTVRAGTNARFSVSATSTVVLTYRWQISTDGGATWSDVSDDAQYTGTTTSSLTVSGASASMADYQYRCQISDGINPAVASAGARLSVQWSQFSALSARAPAGTGDETLILGFVFAGGGKPTLVCGVGPNMSDTVSGYMRDPLLTLYTAGGVEVARNDNWSGTDALSTALTQTGAGPLVAGSKDAALLETLTGSVYTAHVIGVNGTTGVALAAAYDANLSDKTKRLTALSVRNQVGVDDAILIAGFVIAGDAPKQVIVRGVGPGISETVSGYLHDPQLQVWKLDTATGKWTLAGENDDWDHTATTAALFKAVGMGELASDSKDAALVLTLEPGIYTAQVTGVGRTTGVGVVEIYEVP